MAFFEILALIFKFLLQYSYKKSKYLVAGIKSYTFYTWAEVLKKECLVLEWTFLIIW